MKTWTFAAVALTLLAVALISSAARAAAPPPLTYTNPLHFGAGADPNDRDECRDPCLIRQGDHYYMVCTMWPFTDRSAQDPAKPDRNSSPGVRLYVSKNLTHWAPLCWLVKSSDLPDTSPYKHRFWAPEIHKIGGKFYLVFTADNWLKPEYNATGQFGYHAFIGVADRVEGPYRHITYMPDSACDTTIFGDANGRIYAYMPFGDMYAQELDLSRLSQDKVRYKSPRRKIVSSDFGDIHQPSPKYLEGPWVMKAGRRYYLFYAENYADGYWTGVAYADSPLGPWTKDPRGRVFWGGHLAVFDGPDGRHWFSYRGEKYRETWGFLCVDPFDIDAAGRVEAAGPTTTPQAARGGAKSCSPLSAARTVGDPQRPAGLHDAILAAYQAGAQSVTVTPGKYVLPRGPDGAALAFRNLHDFKIDAGGVELAVQDTGQDSVGFSGCANVIFKGAVIHYVAPHTGQGRILVIGRDGGGPYYDVQLDAGYPQDADFKSAMVMDGNSPRFKPGCWDIGARSVTPLGWSGRVRLHFRGDDGTRPRWNVAVGDYITCRGPGATGLHADNCRHCTFQDVTLFWGGVFGFFDTGGVGNRYLHDTITYGPPPPGADNAPLLSQSADGLHCAGARVGPDIEDCAFAGMPDDGIAIHGGYELVARSRGATLTVGSRDGQTQFQVADPVRVQNDKSGLIAEAKVLAVQPSDFQPSRPSRYGVFKDRTLHYFDLTLDGPVDAPFDSLAADPARCGAGYKIVGCTIRDHRARGMLLKADDGLVKNNVIDGSTIAGIVISPETSWGEAGYSHNVVVVGNTIRRTNYAMTGDSNGQAGALTVTGEGSLGNENIQIRNNTFEDLTCANVVVRWARGVTIQGNRFLNPHRRPSPVGEVGKNAGVDGASVVWLGDCRDVTLADNWVRGMGRYGSTLVAAAPTATGVQGAKGGVRLAAH